MLGNNALKNVFQVHTLFSKEFELERNYSASIWNGLHLPVQKVYIYLYLCIYLYIYLDCRSIQVNEPVIDIMCIIMTALEVLPVYLLC